MSEEQDVSIDPATLSRMVALFAAKRNALSPSVIADLAQTIVAELPRATRPVIFSSEPEITDASLEAFCATLLDPRPEAALAFIEERLAAGVRRQSVYLGYLGAAAERLGEKWEKDQISFADVTLGTTHLYALLRAMRIERRYSSMLTDSRRTALFAPVPGEQHSLGISIAAEVFRDAGWVIDLRIPRTIPELVDHAQRSKPWLIGLSVSTEKNLENLVRLVVKLKLARPETIIGVAPGDAFSDQAIRELVDIDLVFRDAPSARIELDRLIAATGGE